MEHITERSYYILTTRGITAKFELRPILKPLSRFPTFLRAHCRERDTSPAGRFFFNRALGYCASACVAGRNISDIRARGALFYVKVYVTRKRKQRATGHAAVEVAEEKGRARRKYIARCLPRERCGAKYIYESLARARAGV